MRASSIASRRSVQGCQRRVPLVQVDDPGLDSESAQRADAADPEQRVLGLARAVVPDVELRGDPTQYSCC